MEMEMEMEREMIEKCYFQTVVNQHRAPPFIRTWAEDTVLITLYLYKVRAVQPNRSTPLSYEQYSQIARKYCTIVLSRFKRRRNADRYRRKLYQFLTSMGVPHVEQPKVAQQLFPVLEASVSTNSIDVCVFDMTLIYPRSLARDRDRDVRVHVRERVVPPPKLIPASKSSIQGLEPVTLDDCVIKQTPECPICLQGFAAAVKPVTALPCTHRYHVHCIVQWLEKSHLCPVCRHAMPVEDDDHSDVAP